MKQTDLQTDESVAKEEKYTVLLKGIFKGGNGTLYLTNQRLLFYKSPLIPSGLFGLLGALIRYLLEEKLSVNLHLANISSIDKLTNFFNKNILFIKTKEGEEFKISVKKAEEWIAAIDMAKEI